ncbi:MAG: P-II family nitrogen regulator [Chloroflexi bacterium]|nr:P-II family nitrogen regulator [Chloroflexota bacterium]
MKEIIAIIRPEMLGATREALAPWSVLEVAQRRVLGRGRQGGLRYLRRQAGGGEAGIPFLPKRMVVWLVSGEKVEDVVAAIIRVNSGGNYGDGKIFVRPTEGAW